MSPQCRSDICEGRRGRKDWVESLKLQYSSKKASARLVQTFPCKSCSLAIPCVGQKGTGTSTPAMISSQLPVTLTPREVWFCCEHCHGSRGATAGAVHRMCSWQQFSGKRFQGAFLGHTLCLCVFFGDSTCGFCHICNMFGFPSRFQDH